LGDASRFQNHFSEIGEDGQISCSLDEETLSKKENFWGICLLAEIFTFTFLSTIRRGSLFTYLLSDPNHKHELEAFQS